MVAIMHYKSVTDVSVRLLPMCPVCTRKRNPTLYLKTML